MAIHLNRTTLAEHMGVALPTVDAWVKAGCPVVRRGSRGVEWCFDLTDIIKWWGSEKARQAAGERPDDLAEIEKRTAIAKMQRAELELAKDQGEVGSIRDFERAQSRIMAGIRANIMNVPSRAVLQLLGCTDESEFKSKLRAELTLALEQSAEIDLGEAEDDPEA